MLRFSLASSLRFFAGGHRGVVTPVPIPNTEVKGSFAEGSAGLARARVGRRRLFYFFKRRASDFGCLFRFYERWRRPSGAPLLGHRLRRLTAFGGYSGFFIFSFGALSDSVTCLGANPRSAGLFFFEIILSFLQTIVV